MPKAKNNKQTCKPGSVPAKKQISIIYLGFQSPKTSSDLPLPFFDNLKKGEQPYHGIYMVLQPIRRTAIDVTANTGKLLPYLFTLTLYKLVL